MTSFVLRIWDAQEERYITTNDTNLILKSETSLNLTYLTSDYHSDKTTFNFSLLLNYTSYKAFLPFEYTPISLYKSENGILTDILFTGVAFVTNSIHVDRLFRFKDNDLRLVDFIAEDYSKLFDISAKEILSLFASFKELFICNAEYKERSIIHNLVKYLAKPILIADIILPYTTKSFVILEGENILEKLKLLLFEFGLYMYFDSIGVLYIAEINIAIEEDAESIDCRSNLNEMYNENKIKYLDVSWFLTNERTKSDLIANKRNAWGVAMRPNPENPAENQYPAEIPLSINENVGYYPPRPANGELSYQQLDASGFLDFNLNFDVNSLTQFGNIYTANKDLSIIDYYNEEFYYKIKTEEDSEGNEVDVSEDVILNRFEVRRQGANSSFAFELKNILDSDTYPDGTPRPFDGIRRVTEAGFVADFLYRSSKQRIFLEDETLFKDSEKWQATLEYVNDEFNANKFFQLTQNRLKNGRSTFTFELDKNLDLMRQYKLIARDTVGELTFYVLIISKTLNSNSNIISYSAISVFSQEEFKTDSENTETQPPPFAHNVYMANVWDKHLPAFEYTNYINDATSFAVVDLEGQKLVSDIKLYAGRYYMNAFIDFKSKFKAVSEQESIYIRKRPLLKIDFSPFEIANLHISAIEPIPIKAKVANKMVQGKLSSKVFKHRLN